VKKILISVLIILLLILTYFALTRGINFLNIKSINDIKIASDKLDNDFNKAIEISNKTYPAEMQGLEEAIKELKISKQEYENKSSYITAEDSLGVVTVKTYKIHYLWTILGNYRKDRGVESLNLDLKTTGAQNVYDLDFTLVGNYTNITDFLYDIENDEELNFEIQNFEISSEVESSVSGNTNNNSLEDSTNTNTVGNNKTNNSNTVKQQNDTNKNSKVKNNGITLQAKFTVENIGVTLD